jgi:hypothetical protein
VEAERGIDGIAMLQSQLFGTPSGELINNGQLLEATGWKTGTTRVQNWRPKLVSKGVDVLQLSSLEKQSRAATQVRFPKFGSTGEKGAT